MTVILPAPPATARLQLHAPHAQPPLISSPTQQEDTVYLHVQWLGISLSVANAKVVIPLAVLAMESLPLTVPTVQSTSTSQVGTVDLYVQMEPIPTRQHGNV